MDERERVDEGPDLTEEDERLLDLAWRMVAEQLANEPEAEEWNGE